MRVGFTAGAFDLVHAGHVLMFKEAKENCDELVVALHCDPSTERAEKNKPVMSVDERLILLRGCRYIDRVLIYHTEKDLWNMLAEMHPDIRFLGEDWKGKRFTGWELNIPIFWNKRDHGFSSSELRARIKAS